MANDLMGLFGPTPDEIAQQQQSSIASQAMDYSKLDPFQQATYAIGRGAGMLATSGAKSLGMVSPQEQMAQQAKAAIQGLDTSTYEGLMEGARRLMNVNPALAQRWVQEARKTKEAQTAEDLKRSQIKKNEAYQPAGARDPETLQLLEEMSTLEEQGLQDSPKYKALEARVKFLSTAKGGVFGAGTVKRMSTNIGEVVFDPAQRKYTYADGSDIAPEDLRRMQPLNNDPTNVAAVANARATGTAVGKSVSGAAIGLIDAEPLATVQLRQLDELIKHPGLSGAVGVGLPYASKIPGSKEADFTARFDQVTGGAFLQAFNGLRGGGQITEAEGNKATAALLRAKTTQSEAEFKDAIKEYADIIKMGLERLRKKASMTPASVMGGQVAPMPQGIPQNTSVAPIPTTGSKEADQIATYRKEYQDAKRKLETPGEDKAFWTKYIGDLQREAKSKGFSLDGELYPGTSSQSAPATERWERIGGRLVKVK